MFKFNNFQLILAVKWICVIFSSEILIQLQVLAKLGEIFIVSTTWLLFDWLSLDSQVWPRRARERCSRWLWCRPGEWWSRRTPTCCVLSSHASQTPGQKTQHNIVHTKYLVQIKFTQYGLVKIYIVPWALNEVIWCQGCEQADILSGNHKTIMIQIGAMEGKIWTNINNV